MKYALTIALTLIVGFVGLVIYVENRIEDKQRIIWNNGIHSCGGKWGILNASYSRGVTYYHYKCSKCDAIGTFRENVIKESR